MAKDMTREIALIEHEASVTVTGVLTTVDHSFHIKNAHNIPDFDSLLHDLLNAIRSLEFRTGVGTKALFYLVIGLVLLNLIFFSITLQAL